jgi:hypothetical protein
MFNENVKTLDGQSLNMLTVRNLIIIEFFYVCVNLVHDIYIRIMCGRKICRDKSGFISIF